MSLLGILTVEDMRYVLLHTFYYKELITENGSKKGTYKISCPICHEIDVDFTSYLLLSC